MKIKAHVHIYSTVHQLFRSYIYVHTYMYTFACGTYVLTYIHTYIHIYTEREREILQYCLVLTLHALVERIHWIQLPWRPQPWLRHKPGPGMGWSQSVSPYCSWAGGCPFWGESQTQDHWCVRGPPGGVQPSLSDWRRLLCGACHWEPSRSTSEESPKCCESQSPLNRQSLGMKKRTQRITVYFNYE